MFDRQSGSYYLSADSVVGTSGKPIRIFSVEVLSGASAGELVLRNGTSASGTIYVKRDGIANKTVNFEWVHGFYFPDGCFFDKDTNVTSVVINCRVE